ncbi:UbiA family prenyltransferase [Kitasatospora sp. NBC_00315]
MRFTTAFILATGNSGVKVGHLLSGVVSWAFGTLFAYVLNGAMDVAEDRLNGSGRPVARGALTPETALRAAWLCAGIAVLVSLDSPSVLGLLLAYLFCGFAYSAPPFNMTRRSHSTMATILLLGGLTYAAGWAATDGRRDTVSAIVFAIAMSAWMGLVGAVVKDLSDVRGDAAAGRRTSVVAWGERRARLVCAVSPVLVGGGFLAAALLVAPVLTVSAVLVLAGGLTVAYFSLTTRSDERRSRSRLPYRAFMVTQYVAHLALLVIVLT